MNTPEPGANDGRRGVIAALVAMISVVLLGGTGIAVSSSTQSGGTLQATRELAIADPQYPFANTSIFRRDLTTAPVDPQSSPMVNHLVQQITTKYNGVAAVNTREYSNSVAVASASDPKVNVAFDDCQGKGAVPEEVDPNRAGSAFHQVPLPASASPSPGGDQQLSIWDPEQDKLWEFWKAERSGGGLKACWGGRIDDVSKSEGTFEGYTGATASGTAFMGQAVSAEEAAAAIESNRGINHIMYLALTDPASWDNVVWPAKRSDGHSTDPNAIPEGARLRLDPSVDVDALDITPFAKAVAKGAQRFGFLVADKAGAVNISARFAPTESWDRVFGGTPSFEVLRGFPWERMQVIDLTYGDKTPPLKGDLVTISDGDAASSGSSDTATAVGSQPSATSTAQPSEASQSGSSPTSTGNPDSSPTSTGNPEPTSAPKPEMPSSTGGPSSDPSAPAAPTCPAQPTETVTVTVTASPEATATTPHPAAPSTPSGTASTSVPAPAPSGGQSELPVKVLPHPAPDPTSEDDWWVIVIGRHHR